MPIGFFDKEYYMLSNFSAHAVLYKGKLYPTAEHAYHTGKFTDKHIHEAIRAARSPMAAKKLANETYSDKRRPDWNDLKVAVMQEVNRAKAEQHPEVRAALLQSGGEELVEDSPHDSFWGCGGAGTGQNQMGKIWMKIRTELQQS